MTLNVEKLVKKIKENRYILLFIIVYAFLLTMANEFFFASNRMADYDQAIYQYIGHLITEGKMPYVDAFDHKGPLLYLIYALGCLINMKWGPWIINCAVMACILMISYCIAHRFVDRVWSVIICFILYSGFSSLDFRGGTPEFFAALFTAISLYYLIDYYIKHNICRKHLLFMGVSGGCIFWLKHSTIITVLLICGFIVIECFAKKKARAAVKYIVWYGIGFGLISAVTCAWILINGAGREMIEDYIVANLLYAGNTTLFNRAQAFLYLSTHSSAVIIWLMLFAYLLLILSSVKKTKKRDKNLILHTSLALILSLLFFSMPGRNYYHYLSTLFPLWVLMGAYLLKELTFENSSKSVLVIEIAGMAVLLYTAVWPNFQKFYSTNVDSWTEDSSDTQMITCINEYTSDNGKISVLGGSAGFYLASGHESATSYPYIASAVLNDPKRGEDYRKQINDSRPEVIIVEPSQDEYTLLGYEILKEYYLTDTINSQKVYVRKDRTKFVSSEQELKAVIDPEYYLSLLAQTDGCTILFAVKDTQGYELNETLVGGLERLGFTGLNELLEKEYHTFAGMIQNGQAVYQEIGSQDEAIRYNGNLDGCALRLDSKCFQYGNQASIQIDGVEYAVNKRGINIVVYSNKTHEVIDAVAFDTHSANYPCYR